MIVVLLSSLLSLALKKVGFYFLRIFPILRIDIRCGYFLSGIEQEDFDVSLSASPLDPPYFYPIQPTAMHIPGGNVAITRTTLAVK